jgi:hypothetical protein
MNDFFPSNYMKAAEFGTGLVVGTIAGIHAASFENDGKTRSKPVMTFTEPNLKALVVNKTNFLTLAAAFGDNTEGWVGKMIQLVKMRVPFKGTLTDSIKVKPLNGATQVASDTDFEDEVPF